MVSMLLMLWVHVYFVSIFVVRINEGCTLMVVAMFFTFTFKTNL